MDVLTEVLGSVRLDSKLWGHLKLTAPWSLRVDGLKESAFYIITQGSCLLQLDPREDTAAQHLNVPRKLEAGDLVLLMQGYGHILSDTVASQHKNIPTTSLGEVLTAKDDTGRGDVQNGYHYGGGGTATSLVGGGFYFCNRKACPLLSALPPLIHLTQDQIRKETGHPAEWLESTVRFLFYEATSSHPGAPIITSRLSEILFIQAVRAYLANLPDSERGWLRALVDPQIGATLALIHRHLNRSWTVAELAFQVAMSRAAFAARFRRLVGEPPLQYITRWRMQEAAKALCQQGISLAEIAVGVGYESEAAFNKVFKRWMGQTPGAYRKAILARESPAVAHESEPPSNSSEAAPLTLIA